MSGKWVKFKKLTSQKSQYKQFWLVTIVNSDSIISLASISILVNYYCISVQQTTSFTPLWWASSLQPHSMTQVISHIHRSLSATRKRMMQFLVANGHSSNSCSPSVCRSVCLSHLWHLLATSRACHSLFWIVFIFQYAINLQQGHNICW